MSKIITAKGHYHICTNFQGMQIFEDATNSAILQLYFQGSPTL